MVVGGLYGYLNWADAMSVHSEMLTEHKYVPPELSQRVSRM